MVRSVIDFRHMRAVGIDVAVSAVAVADMRQRFGTYTLRAARRQESKTPFISNGVFLDIPRLAESIRTALQSAEPHPIKAPSAFFCVPESVVFTHVFSFPRELDHKAVQDGIDIQFSEYFPFDIEACAYDWKVVQQSDQTQMVMVTACDRLYVDQLTRLAAELNISIAGIDIESVSRSRALLPSFKGPDTGLLVDIGARVTSLNIFGEEGLQSTMVLEIGGQRLTELIADKLEMELSEAEQVKRSTSLDPAHTSHSDLVTQIIRQHLHPVLEEMKRSIRFFEASRKRTVGEVVLTGGTSRILGLPELMQTELKQPVRVGESTHRLKSQKIVSPTDAPEYTTAIGLALGGVDRRFEPSRYNIGRYIDTTPI